MPHDPTTDGRQGSEPKQPLTVTRTTTGYWTVQRGTVQLAFAMTREAAENERELLRSLGRSRSRRTGRRPAARA
jgi:hypothetical protein